SRSGSLTAYDYSITREIGMRAFLVSVGLLAASGTLWGDNPQRSDRALVKRAAVIKPAPEELRWQQIPWVTDLTEGQRLANAALPDLLLSSLAHAYAGEYGR